MRTKRETNSIHDIDHLGRCPGHLVGTCLRLEGRSIRGADCKISQVSSVAGYLLSNLCNLYNILFSIDIDAHFLLENLPSK